MLMASDFKIEGREIGNSSPPYCIAEVGINHNGDLNSALKTAVLTSSNWSTWANKGQSAAPAREKSKLRYNSEVEE